VKNEREKEIRAFLRHLLLCIENDRGYTVTLTDRNGWAEEIRRLLRTPRAKPARAAGRRKQ
jgi:hypothetical protein